MIFFLFNIREEAKIPSVEGCELKLLERCQSHGQG